jgi:pimeloyl-ACP methyl ester carboxylesterase
MRGFSLGRSEEIVLEPDIVATQLRTSRTATFVRLLPGRSAATPVVLVHGNLSSSVFFEPLMRLMPQRFRPLAVDLRGFGGSDPEPVDATRGVRDFSDDVLAAMDALEINRAHLVGWSLGGSVAMQMALDAPRRVTSMTLIAPISPYGFGGTVDERGALLAPDAAGCGAGMVSRAVVRAFADHDTSDDRAGARAMLRRFYLGADRGEAAIDRSAEDELVAGMLSTVVGPENYPGDVTPSTNWPGWAPGTHGVMNAISPRYLDVSGPAGIAPKPPVLWIRGSADRVISDDSGMDFVARARAAAMDGYPGEAAAPPQPMLAQTRAVLTAKVAAGGSVREVVIDGAAHAPHLTALPEVLESLIPHLDGAAGA